MTSGTTCSHRVLKDFVNTQKRWGPRQPNRLDSRLSATVILRQEHSPYSNQAPHVPRMECLMSPQPSIDFDDFPTQPAIKVPQPAHKAPIRVEFPPIDVRLLTEQCLGNLAFGVSLLEKFQETATDRLQHLREHVAQRNLPAVGEMAHSLKGVVGILAADCLLDLSTNLQHAAETDDVEFIDELLPQIEHELQRLQDEIPRLRSLL